MAPARNGTDANRHQRFVLAVTVFTLAFVALEARLFYLQILHGEDYRERARISVIARERIPPRRGLVKDREGRVLARNVASYHLTLTPHYVADPDVRAATLERLAGILLLSSQQQEALEGEVIAAIEAGRRWEPQRLAGALVAGHCPHDGTALELLEEPDRAFFCPDEASLHRLLDPKAVYCPYDRKRLAWDEAHAHARCGSCDRSFASAPTCPGATGHEPLAVTHNLGCPVCDRRFSNQVATLRGFLYELPGVEVATELDREYPFGYEAAHVIGYMNRVTAEDRERFPGTYSLRDVIGRTGIERALESILRGQSGEALHIRNARGHRQSDLGGLAGEREFRRAVPGHDVWLTLDMRLQKEVRRAFRYYKSGAGIVVDPRSGEVLAAYSKPGFDPNAWSGRLSPELWQETTENPYSPLINKAVTAYAPGSVYKLVTSVAALTEGVVSPELTIDCPGFYEFGGRRFGCHLDIGHGAVDLVRALEYSCDVYFYRVGEMLGMDRLAHYGQLFGYGSPAGLGIAERHGRVPTREWHAEHTALGWQPGFTLSTAIGQGSLTATPAQVARSVVALANGGYLLDLRLVRRVVDERGDVIQELGPQLERQLDVPAEALALVREGFVRVVNFPHGTARDVALDSIVMAGKTGTAEAAQVRAGSSPEMARWLEEDHAWFAAYAPAEDPQVVVVVFLEHGGSGSKMAAPIAQRIVKAWMRLGIYEPAETPDELDPMDDPPAEGAAP